MKNREPKTKSKTVRAQGTVRCIAEYSDTSGRWIGSCEKLGIFVEANTLDELRSRFLDAFELLLADLIEDNEFDEFFKSKGFISEDEVTPRRLSWEMLAQGGEVNGFAQAVA